MWKWFSVHRISRTIGWLVVLDEWNAWDGKLLTDPGQAGWARPGRDRVGYRPARVYSSSIGDMRPLRRCKLERWPISTAALLLYERIAVIDLVSDCSGFFDFWTDTMRVKKQKQLRRHVSFYKTCFGFREPFKVLCDGTFVHHNLAQRLGALPDSLSTLLGAPAKPIVSRYISIPGFGVSRVYGLRCSRLQCWMLELQVCDSRAEEAGWGVLGFCARC